MHELTLPAPRRARSLNLSPQALLWPVILFLLVFFILPITWFFVRTAIDYDGNFLIMLWQTFSSPMFIKVAWQTLWLSFVVTIIALLAAYPIAYSLTRAGPLGVTLIIICVIVPYFTSLIVRTYSWMIILGNKGVLNETLIALNIIDAPLRLMYNKFGVVVGMAYVLLPYFVLTIYSSMKSIDMWLLQAGRSMGASNFYVFRRIFLPLSMPGVISGFLIVFILAVGFFVTPALMGGPNEVMIAMLIQRNIEVTMDWAQASALSLFLLTITLLVFAVYCKYTDLDKMLGRSEAP